MLQVFVLIKPMKKNTLKQLVRKDLLKTESYAPGKSAWDLAQRFDISVENLIKLNANENPYGPSPRARKAITETKFINYYPDGTYKNLREALAQYTNTKPENIVVGSGSDEIIDLLLKLILSEGDSIITTPPSFSMYEIYAKLYKGNVISVPRESDFSLDIPAIKKAFTKKVKAIFICNPNNPTGTITTLKEIEELLQLETLIVVDEAYFEFSNLTAVGLLKKYDNLIILRTFSKWAGLAGLRIGYGIMNPFFAEKLMGIKSPFNVNLLADTTAIATLEDLSFAKKSIQKIVSEKEIMYKKLSQIGFLNIYPSYGNFLFVQLKNKQYKKLKNVFEKNKIAVRFFETGVRITIGTPQQNNKVLKALQEFKPKYAFLDRDGTLIFEPQDTFQIDSIKKLKILDGVIEGLKELNDRGYEFIMISNQNGIGTASFPKANFEAPQNKMLNIFEKNGIKFKEIFICPHLPSDNCNCRKPKAGLVEKFLIKNQIDKDKSFVCGDRLTDKLFAENIGVKFISMKTNGNFYNELKKGGIIA